MPVKLLYILIITVLTTGCGETLKSSWGNFHAYYNTYYNAKESFRAGLKKVQKQSATIDPAQPVPVHSIPVQTGNDDFEKAIEKGTQVLQDFSNSKWIDDALLLIGKSYYYQHKFYPALQRFEELRNASSPKMQQLAIIWKGKALFALKRYKDGANYLEAELGGNFGESSKEGKAELQVLVGEYHAMLEHWDQASQWLSKAIAGLEEKKLLGRTLFLYGQVLERSQRYGEAYFAFSQVSENFPGFEYAYWAAVKRADVVRKEGNIDLAISIYKDLRKDDKNIQRRDELNFRIARTLEVKGETDQALRLYKNLLNSDQKPQNLQSDIYYRLGKIHSDKLNNYSVAAAYFDSSSSRGNTKKPSDAATDAQTLASAFGKYNSLQKTIHRSDSLLWLGSLSPQKLDSVIEQIRIRKRNQLLEQREAESKDRLLNQSLQTNDNQTVSSIYGFLNYRNDRLANRGKAEFRVIWGYRPPVDNWRRMEAVQQSSAKGPSPGEITNVTLEDETATILDLNIDEIPVTRGEKAKLRSEKVTAQYELGNLLFLNLNSPDSARIYFHRVIKSPVEKELQARAMYSLYELFNSKNKVDSLEFWKHQILKKYPDSRYAQRIHSKVNGFSANQFDSDHPSKLSGAYQQLITSNGYYKAARLRSFALANRSSSLAPHIFYQALKEYIRQAKALNEMNSFVLSVFSPDSTEMGAANNILQLNRTDTSYSHSAYWDSVRIVIQEFDTIFPNAAQAGKVTKIRRALKQSAPARAISSCKSLGVELKVKPSMKEFMSEVKYPEKIENSSLSGKVTYSFIVTSAGGLQSYQLVSTRTSLGIEEALEANFEQLSFMPLTVDNPPDKIRCTVDFPIRK